MAQACIGSTILVAGGLSCGVLPTLPAAGAGTVTATLLEAVSTAEGNSRSCRTSARTCGLTLSQAQTVDTPVAIISDQIRRQGYACDEPRQAERDRKASRPNLTVWVLRCGNATYRVTLVPDMAARVERLP